MQSIPSIWKGKTLICVCAWIHWFGPIFSCEITCERYEIGMLFRKGFLVLLFPSLHIPFHGTAWTSSFTRSISRNLKVSYICICTQVLYLSMTVSIFTLQVGDGQRLVLYTAQLLKGKCKSETQADRVVKIRIRQCLFLRSNLIIRHVVLL